MGACPAKKSIFTKNSKILWNTYITLILVENSDFEGQKGKKCIKMAQICRNEIKPKNLQKAENHDFGDFEHPLSHTICVEKLWYPTR